MAKSGIAAAHILSDAGATVFVSDAGDDASLSLSTAELSRLGVAYETGGHTDRAFEADFIVTSPGIPEVSKVIKKTIEKKIPLYSEL